MAFYSTATAVKGMTGVKPKDLGLSDEAALDSWLEDRLTEIKGMIDAHRNRDYTQEVTNGDRTEIPVGIHGIALRMAANLVAQALLRRTSPVVRIDDFAVKMVADEVMTKAVKADLSMFPAKPRFRLMRVRSQQEVDGV